MATERRASYHPPVVVTRRLTSGGLVESLSVELARVVVEPRHERQRCVRLGDPDAAQRPSSASDGSPISRRIDQHAREWSTQMTKRSPRVLRVGPIPGHPGPWDDFISWYSPDDIDPPHAPDRSADVELLVKSMAESGWSGRPLLAMRSEGFSKLLAQTGSHRLDAARRVPLDEVPVVVVESYEHVDVSGVSDPLEVLLRFADEDGPELVELGRHLWHCDGYPVT